MGVYAPMPDYGRIRADVESRILFPLRNALANGDLSYKGVLYAGIIYGADEDAPEERSVQLLEFNARFGDPETQAILPLLEGDLYKILYSCTDGTLADQDVVWSRMSSCCVVAAAKSYPESSSKAKVIKIGALPANTKVFHAGTTLDGDLLKTNGGRVLAVNAVRQTLSEARDAAYEAIAAIEFDDMDYRKDIAGRALKQCLSI
jgi:phosphoribosylamine--glycine ligase